MKKIFLSLLFLTVVASTYADTYNYIAFQTSSGTTMTLDASNLIITFENGNLVAVNSSTNQTFAIADLNKMYFTNTATGINEVNTGSESNSFDLYSMSGMLLGKFSDKTEVKGKVPGGVYVAKQSGKTFKFTVE